MVTMKLNEQELKLLRQALAMSISAFPQGGCSYNRALYIKKILNMGDVYTFTVAGVQVSAKDFDAKVNEFPPFVVPSDTSVYRGLVEWRSHSVFVYKGNMVTMELPDVVLLKDYRKKLDELNKNLLATYGMRTLRIRVETKFK